MTFKEILSCLVDKGEDYQRVKDEGLFSTIDPVSIRLVLASQPLRPFKKIVAIEPLPIEPKPEVAAAV